MSHTTLYRVPESGEIEPYAEFNNAFLGAFTVWSEMAKFYLDLEYLPMSNNDGMQQVWDIAKSENVPLNDRIVMATTFDRVMVRREYLLIVAEAFEDFGHRFVPSHLPAQAVKLHELTRDKECYAVCWNQTSVNADTWWVQTDELDGHGERICRMYDVSKDSNHWFLFDDMGEIFHV